jgi:low affinity Fe/Cu permease
MTDNKPTTIVEWIEKFAEFSASPTAFVLAGLSVVFWTLLGPAMSFSGGWQFAINVVSNAGTFLAVFLVQNSQKRARMSLEHKLDRLLMRSSERPLTAQEIRQIVEAELPRAASIKEYLAPGKYFTAPVDAEFEFASTIH